MTQKENKDGQDEGVTLFHLNGDTICTFIAGIDPTTKRGQYLYQPPFFDKIYRYGDQITFRLSFCDTIYRIRDEQTYYPAYVTDFGKLRLTAIERIPFLAGRTNGRLPLHAPHRHRNARTGETHRLAQAKEADRTAGQPEGA